jgi:rubrerythrin
MSITNDNLEDAFAGESQANRKYLAFAKKAEKDGFTEVAKLFRAAAESETIHALEHFRVLGEIKTTKENLGAAIQGEAYEHTEMYPVFINEAKEEGNKAAVQSFNYANSVEKVHEDKFRKALEAINGGKDLPKRKMFICPICGNVEYDQAPDACAVCGTTGSKWKEVQ